MIGRSNKDWGTTMRLGSVTVNVKPKPRTPFSVLKVAGLIDNGTGQQTVILTNGLPNEWEIDLNYLSPNRSKSSRGLSLPRRIANLNCIYTGREFGVVADVTQSLRAVTRNAKLAAIVPEVIAPGDFMIFKHEGPRFRIRFAGIVRAIPQIVK